MFDNANHVINSVRSTSKSSLVDFVWSIHFKTHPLVYKLFFIYANSLTKCGVSEGSIPVPTPLFPTVTSERNLDQYLAGAVHPRFRTAHVRRAGEDWVRLERCPNQMDPVVEAIVLSVYSERKRRSLGHSTLDQESMASLQGHLRVPFGEILM
jgi:hypothetical protein